MIPRGLVRPVGDATHDALKLDRGIWDHRRPRVHLG
jgi:hypothetical protein